MAGRLVQLVVDQDSVINVSVVRAMTGDRRRVVEWTGVQARARCSLREMAMMAGRSITRYGPLVAASLLALLAGACTPRTTIPPGAEQVQLVGTPTEVRLTPSTVRAGDVYLVIEGTGALLVSKSALPDTTRPFTQDELAHFIRTGEAFNTMTQDVTTGYAGNVRKMTLSPGRYVFLPIAAADADPNMIPETRFELCQRDPAACAALPPLPVTVLEVLP